MYLIHLTSCSADADVFTPLPLIQVYSVKFTTNSSFSSFMGNKLFDKSKQSLW